MKKSAEISECGRYRWWLRRSWGNMFSKGNDVVTFVMLNPSKADASIDDPTIRRCIQFAKDWGFDTLSVRNLFAYRATEKRELLKADNPTGGDRGDNELLAARSATLVVAAWGEFVPFGRDVEVLEMFGDREIHVLGFCDNGKPRHPLFMPKSAKPVVWERPVFSAASGTDTPQPPA